MLVGGNLGFMNKKNVLVIAYYFYPFQNVASLRFRGLAKYLDEFGWTPHFLTTSLPDKPDERFCVIQTHYPGNAGALLKQKFHFNPRKGLQEQIKIPAAILENKLPITTKMVDFIRGFIAYPDEQKKWLPYAVETGHQALLTESFSAIISSAGPVTAHLIAAGLKKMHGLPWIADFRDLWTQNHYYPYVLARRLIEKKLERKTIAYADALVTVSQPLADKLGELHSGKKIFTITNGFDPDEIQETPLTKQFTITYAGLVYAGKQNPEPLFAAVKKLIDQQVIHSKNIVIRFFGPPLHWLDEEIKRYRLETVARQYGSVPREIVLSKQRESQILLLLNWNDPNEKGVYTGKIFEYLAARRPIFALGGAADDVVSHLLNETGAGIHVVSEQSILKTLKSWYLEYWSFGCVRYRGKQNAINQYSHREMARKYAQLLDDITGAAGHASVRSIPDVSV